MAKSRSFSVTGPSLWNRLPPSARASFLSSNLSMALSHFSELIEPKVPLLAHSWRYINTWIQYNIIQHLVWETQIVWLTPASENLRTLLVMIELRSANPKSEWSVKTALIFIVRAWNIASWASVEKAYTWTVKHSYISLNHSRRTELYRASFLLVCFTLLLHLWNVVACQPFHIKRYTCARAHTHTHTHTPCPRHSHIGKVLTFPSVLPMDKPQGAEHGGQRNNLLGSIMHKLVK